MYDCDCVNKAGIVLSNLPALFVDTTTNNIDMIWSEKPCALFGEWFWPQASFLQAQVTKSLALLQSNHQVECVDPILKPIGKRKRKKQFRGLGWE